MKAGNKRKKTFRNTNTKENTKTNAIWRPKIQTNAEEKRDLIDFINGLRMMVMMMMMIVMIMMMLMMLMVMMPMMMRRRFNECYQWVGLCGTTAEGRGVFYRNSYLDSLNQLQIWQMLMLKMMLVKMKMLMMMMTR